MKTIRCLRCGYCFEVKKELLIIGRQKNHYYLRCPACDGANPIKKNFARILLGQKILEIYLR